MRRKFLLVLTSVVLLSYPNINFGQAPDLGTASSYALFTAVGAFSNVSTTTVTGDIGTKAGALTGFPPGTVNGQIHVADAASIQAADDVTAAYNALGGVPCVVPLGPTLGSGQVLTPDVYCIGSASTLTGNLILDGAGDPNALFIIKIGGAFSAGTFSSVTLINSASLKNVYWQVNGEFILAANSVFRGTIITNGAISILANSSLLGRGLSIAGAISLNDNTISNAEAVILPVTSLYFSVTRQGSSALLKWSTATEQNSKNFIVERSNSAQATKWKAIGTLAAAGNSTSIRQYSMVDNNVDKGFNYYRLRSIDINGTYAISTVKVVNFDAASSMTIRAFPNPVKNNLTVSGAAQSSTIMLMDMAGKKLKEQLASGNGTDQVGTSRLAPGTYLLKVVLADGTVTTIQLNKR